MSIRQWIISLYSLLMLTVPSSAQLANPSRTFQEARLGAERLVLNNIPSLGFATISPPGNVPPGCAAPSTIGNQWFVDPINGNDLTGSGTLASPWKTLQTVLNNFVSYRSYITPYVSGSSLQPAKGGVIHAGDTIWLESGNHGTVVLRDAFNANYISISGMPGAVVNSVQVTGGSYWAFINLKVQSFTSNEALILLASNGFQGPLNNMYVSNNTIGAADDSTGWSLATWLTINNGINISAGMLLPSGAIDYLGVMNGQCITVSNNMIKNVGAGINVTAADKVLVSYNTINYLTSDGIDYSFSDAVVYGNIITNFIDDGSGIHRDGMQGQMGAGGQQTYNHDISIISNIIIAQTDPNLFSPSCIQGIDAFDGTWYRINVYNNIIFVTDLNALIFYSPQGLNLVNNTVINVGSSPSPCGVQVGTEAIAAGNPVTTDGGNIGGGSGIGIGQSLTKLNIPPTNVVIRNNIASQYFITTIGAMTSLASSGIVAMDHNILASNNSKFSVPQFSGATVVDPANLFVNVSPAEWNFDVHLPSGSMAIGFGNISGAPSLDVYGMPRTRSVDAGAVSAITPDAYVLGGKRNN